MVHLSRRLCVIAIASYILFAAHRAEARGWSGTQILMLLSGEKTVGETPLGVRAQVARLLVPSRGVDVSLVYTGLTLTALKKGKSSLWFSPQLVGNFGRWPGHDAFGLSVWVLASHGPVSLFAECDYVMAGDKESLYGFYAANITPTVGWSFGAHAEHTDRAVHAGPHVSWSNGPFRFQLQYNLGVVRGDQTNAPRAVFGLGF